MRVRGWKVFAATAVALSYIGIAGCSNWQGTSADPDLLSESNDYKNNDDPQNTGAGAGAVAKPSEGPTTNMGGESPSQTAVKGTGTIQGRDNPNDVTITPAGAH
jgi:hypothetical protein